MESNSCIMKTSNVLFLIIILLFSCKKDDINVDDKENNKFMGKWHVTNISGYIFQSESFNEGEIIWDFYSFDSLNICINVNLTNQSIHPFKKDTSLNYSFDSLDIMIGNTSYNYLYNINDSTLKLLYQYSSDGILIEFEKN